ncbi:MAG: MFS transporter, partial [Pararhodobacter sp.]
MTLSWFQIARLGTVQMCLGAIVVLMTSTLNRLMAVELSLPIVVPGFLVALHYGVQISRPSWGFLSDAGGNRTRWIIGGMGMLAGGALMAAGALALFPVSFWGGMAVSMLAYAVIGLGVGASGTSLLALLATATAPHRRPAAATITWLMMIAGIVLTALATGQALDPYSHPRLMVIVGVVAAVAMSLTTLAIWGIERRVVTTREPRPMPLRQGLAEIWAEPRARMFTLFVFLAMSAYFMQELILEPYAGLVFHLSPGQTTTLSGAQNGGVFLGMLAVGVLATGLGLGSLKAWVVAGCLGSAAALLALALLGTTGDAALLTPAVMALGLFNGMFAVAAIGS